MRKGLLIILIGFILLACGDGNVIIQVDPNVQFRADSTAIIEYLQMKGYTEDEIGNTENGIRYVILDEGSGIQIDESDFVEFNYIGITLEDIIFDTSIKEVSDSLSAYYEENPIVENEDTISVFTRTTFEPSFITYSSSGWTTPSGLIPGWGEGIAATFDKLKEGGSVLIAIPSSQAYGARGVGVFIEPNTPIAFELIPIKVTKQP